MALTFDQWAALTETKKVFAAQLSLGLLADSGSTTVTVYLSNYSGVWDGTNYYVPLITQGGKPSVTHQAQQIVYGKSLVTYGQLKLGYDATTLLTGSLTMDDLLADYAWAGRGITIKVGDDSLAWADWGTVIDGYMGQPKFDKHGVTLPIFGKANKLAEIQMPPNVYGVDDWPTWEASTAYTKYWFVSPSTSTGYQYECTTAGTSGGTEPTWPEVPGNTVNDNTAVWTCREMPANTVGKARPIIYGQIYRGPAILIESVNDLYQVCDEVYCPIEDITEVADSGVIINAANYTVTKSNGSIRFAGAYVPLGEITASVRGIKPGGTYSAKPGDIWEDIVKTFGGFSASDIDSTALSTYNTDVSQGVGLAVLEPTDIKSVLDSLLGGLTTVQDVTRAGKFTLHRFQAPSGSPDLELDSENVLPTPQHEFEERIYWRAVIKGQRNWSFGGSLETDGSISAAWTEWLRVEWRERVSSDSSIKDLYPLAGECAHETMLTSLTALTTVAGWWTTLFGQRRMIATCRLKLQPLAVELGDVVQLTLDRFGLGSGKLFRVVGITSDYNSGEMTLRLWGGVDV